MSIPNISLALKLDSQTNHCQRSAQHKTKEREKERERDHLSQALITKSETAAIHSELTAEVKIEEPTRLRCHLSIWEQNRVAPMERVNKNKHKLAKCLDRTGDS